MQGPKLTLTIVVADVNEQFDDL